MHKEVSTAPLRLPDRRMEGQPSEPIDSNSPFAPFGDWNLNMFPAAIERVDRFGGGPWVRKCSAIADHNDVLDRVRLQVGSIGASQYAV